MDQTAHSLERITPKVIVLGSLHLRKVLQRVHVEHASHEIVDMRAESELEQCQNRIGVHYIPAYMSDARAAQTGI
jgi:hypothetical protein